MRARSCLIVTQTRRNASDTSDLGDPQPHDHNGGVAADLDTWGESLVEDWLGAGCRFTPLRGGMNSSVWAVDGAGGRFALKIHDSSMLPGLEVARELGQRGVACGEPLRVSRDGDRVAALLRWVPGEPLTWKDGTLIGTTLKRVHDALEVVPPPHDISTWPWDWLELETITDPAVADLARSVVRDAEEIARRLPHGILHGDPAPEAFISDDGAVGLIDWGSAFYGPLLYDVASAVMYSDRTVVAAYGEIADDDLRTFLAFRAVVQIWYFANRIARGNLAGADADGNRSGFESGVSMLRRVLDTRRSATP
jgi:Ser/Thr protein kinase RdoA (MazF antagonist)